MSQEQFGTTTPIYNKLFYNSRGQLSEIREGLTGNNTAWERGAIINHYSDTCWGMCWDPNTNTGSSMTDNNGNLKKQEHWIQDGNGNVTAIFTQQYDYDSLNRIQRVHDGANWQQQYSYDRYGNRTIDQANTFGTGIPKPNFTVNTANNRLGVPSGQTGTMSYDNAGNLTTDTYSGAAVLRAYDAENRMTSETQANNNVAGSYSYDGNGQRMRRNINNVETWQVYGLGGELLAEYAQNGSAASPQKEYGYRNGQLLITARAGNSWGSPPVLHDNPLLVGATTVQSRHITELRAAIDALRTHVSLSAYQWQTSAAPGDLIKADPILEMRTALDQALGAPSPAYSAGLAQGQPIKAIHIQELRDRVLAAWSNGSPFQMNWLVSDQLGTPRMIFDLNGSLANVSRHDYLPFGEELFAGTGGRALAQGYTNSDGTRQKFTQKERDNETGLDYFLARYYSSTQGRFTSVDPVSAINYQQTYQRSKELRDFRMFLRRLENPQTWNAYPYSLNNPLRFVDPNGEEIVTNEAEVNEAIRKRKLETQRAQLTEYAKTLAADIKKGKLTSKEAIDKFHDKAMELTGKNTASALLIATGSALDLRSNTNLEGRRENIASRITEGSLGQDTLHHFFINAFNNYENPITGPVSTIAGNRDETDPEDRFANTQGARFGELLAEPHLIVPSLKEKYIVESPDGFRFTYYRDPLRPSFVIP
jgi:RHS repeat-associated protein